MVSDDEDDDAVVLCSDAYDVVHVVYAAGSTRYPICTTWNQNLTGNRLMWGKPLPHDVPSCVYCVARAAAWRREGPTT